MVKKTRKEIEARMSAISEEIENNPKENMNTLLAPELYGFDEERMTAEIGFRRYGWETNERGERHGGAISAMFDTAMGMTVLAFSDSENISTADLSVSFIRPFLGESYLFKTEIVHPGRTIVRVRAIAYDEKSGKPLASATANFFRLDR